MLSSSSPSVLTVMSSMHVIIDYILFLCPNSNFQSLLVLFHIQLFFNFIYDYFPLLFLVMVVFLH